MSNNSQLAIFTLDSEFDQVIRFETTWGFTNCRIFSFQLALDIFRLTFQPSCLLVISFYCIFLLFVFDFFSAFCASVLC